MSNLALNFNTGNLYGKDYFNQQTSLNANNSFGGFGLNNLSLFSFAPSFSTLPTFGGFSGFGSFESTPTDSMFMGSVAANKPSFDSNNYFGIMPAMPELKFPEPKLNYTINPFKSKPALNKDGSPDYRISSLNTQTPLQEITSFYNPNKGLSLAKATVSNVHSRSTGYCARYVKTALSNTGLSPYYSGHAFQLADNLDGNKNFKEVAVAPKDLKKLPAGCVIVYARGAADASKTYGHTEVTLGNGKAASDFLRNNIKESNNVRVFVPV